MTFDRYQHFPLILISDRCFSKVGYLVESNTFQGQKTQVFGSHPRYVHVFAQLRSKQQSTVVQCMVATEVGVCWSSLKRHSVQVSTTNEVHEQLTMNIDVS